MSPHKGPFSEFTPPWIAILGAIFITFFAIFAFSFWPNSSSLVTDATGDGPHKPGQVAIPTNPPPAVQ